METQQKDLQRIETFSDGVFAIAATLLILEIKVPHADDVNAAGGLLNALLNKWPSYLAYFLSFGSILVMWMNHHRTSKLLVRSSMTYIFANGVLLLTVTFIPFPTAVLAEHINSADRNSAVMFYSFGYMVANFGFNIWFYAMLRPIKLFRDQINKPHLRKLAIQTSSGFFIYLGSTILAYWFPILALIIIFSLFILWVSMSIGYKEQVMSDE